MGYITTPKGIDFTIKSKPLTDKERKEISDFIKKSKQQNTNKVEPFFQKEKVLLKSSI